MDMKLPEKKQRWVYHAEALPQTAGEGVTRRVLAYTDGLMCVENTFEKGAVGALHHHPHTQITYVVSGAFDFTVDGVTHTVRAGDTILKEDGVEHVEPVTDAAIHQNGHAALDLRGDGGGEGLERTHALLSGPFAVQGQSAECRLNGKAETADLDEIQFQGKVNAHAAQQRNQAVHSPQKSIDFGHDFGQLFHHGTHSPANRRLRRRDRTRPPPASAASRTEKTLLLF